MEVIEAPIPTDHRAVMTTFRFRWKEKAKQKEKQQEGESPEPERDHSALANSREAREKYGKQFVKSLESLGGYDIDNVSAFDAMERMKKAVELADKSLPLKKEGPRVQAGAKGLVPGIQELEKKVKEWRESRLDAVSDKQDEDKRKAEMKRINKEADAHLRQESGRLLTEYIQLIPGDPWHAWQRVFALEKQLKVKKAETITMGRFEDHFNGVFRPSQQGRQEVKLPAQRPWERDGRDAPVFNTGPCNFDEIKKCAWSQANHKARGRDKIPAEVLKCDEVLHLCVPLFNKALQRADPTADLTDDDIPPQFFDAILVALFKKGDVEDTNNYRGISLMSYVAKLFHLFLMHRVRSALDQYLSDSQNAYRPSRGCQQHCVAASVLHQYAKKHPGYQLHMLFVDFRKAFDSVDHKAMEKILLWWSIPPGLVKIMMTMVNEHRLFVRHEGELSATPINPLSGVLQGDTMAPYIFILCMDIILQQLPEEWGASIENAVDTDEYGNHIVHGSRRQVSGSWEWRNPNHVWRGPL